MVLMVLMVFSFRLRWSGEATLFTQTEVRGLVVSFNVVVHVVLHTRFATSDSSRHHFMWWTMVTFWIWTSRFTCKCRMFSFITNWIITFKPINYHRPQTALFLGQLFEDLLHWLNQYLRKFSYLWNMPLNNRLILDEAKKAGPTRKSGNDDKKSKSP